MRSSSAGHSALSVVSSGCSKPQPSVPSVATQAKSLAVCSGVLVPVVYVRKRG
jgi:hypothetical protein